jgi:anthranilate phosphoribosyltransferase
MNSLKPIEEGILKVGIGKYGSEPIPNELADLIIQEIENPIVSSIQKGALIGALYLKGFENDGEKKIQKYFRLYNPQNITEQFCLYVKKHQKHLLDILEKLLSQKTLSIEESYLVGKFLFDPDIPEDQEFEIGLITTIFRFRYETIEEYVGLLKSIEEQFGEQWYPFDKKAVIITEPFDGVERSFLFTPLIGNLLIKNHFIPIYIVSDNPGPKFHYNLKDLAIKLNAPFVKSTEELKEKIKEPNPYGFFIDVKDLSPILIRWIQRRKLLKKRPFLATLERIYNPINASIQIFSAFHPPYLEKTTDVLKHKNIPVIFGIRRGEEGGLTFSFNKRNETLLSIRKNQEYEQKSNFYFMASTSKFDFTPSIENNKRIIESYLNYQNLKEIENLDEEQKQYFTLQIQKTLEIYQNLIKEIDNA